MDEGAADQLAVRRERRSMKPTSLSGELGTLPADGDDAARARQRRSLARSLAQLDALRSLPENWDGYHGAAPRVELIDRVTRFLEFWNDYLPLPAPHISPTRTGGVLVEWERGPHQLEVEFDPPADVTFAYLRAGSDESASGSLTPATTGMMLHFVSLLQRLSPS